VGAFGISFGPKVRRIPVLLVLLAPTIGGSGQFEDGLAARDRGDVSTAFRTFKQLANSGDASSQFQLSLLYSAGKGVNADGKQALYWLRQAATRGNVQAQSNLGVAFNMGRGVTQDPIKAYAWLSIAASGGDSVASTNRDVVARKLSPVQLEQAKALANNCLQEYFKPCL
jgi:TPR repeat protein